jgi:hypothetical protein
VALETISQCMEREHGLERQSLTLALGDAKMMAHLDGVDACLASLLHHVNERIEQNPSELVVQRLGIRIFADIASALRLALAGYYQPAWSAIRDIMEVELLLDDFDGDPGKPERWANLERQAREKEYRPVKVRERLNARYAAKEDKRRKQYGLYSNLASHVSPEGFTLTAPILNMSILGPFFHEPFLRELLHDLARHSLAATINMSILLPAISAADDEAKRVFQMAAGEWAELFVRGEEPKKPA